MNLKISKGDRRIKKVEKFQIIQLQRLVYTQSRRYNNCTFAHLHILQGQHGGVGGAQHVMLIRGPTRAWNGWPKFNSYTSSSIPQNTGDVLIILQLCRDGSRNSNPNKQVKVCPNMAYFFSKMVQFISKAFTQIKYNENLFIN